MDLYKGYLTEMPTEDMHVSGRKTTTDEGIVAVIYKLVYELVLAESMLAALADKSFRTRLPFARWKHGQKYSHFQNIMHTVQTDIGYEILALFSWNSEDFKMRHVYIKKTSLNRKGKVQRSSF